MDKNHVRNGYLKRFGLAVGIMASNSLVILAVGNDPHVVEILLALLVAFAGFAMYVFLPNGD